MTWHELTPEQRTSKHRDALAQVKSEQREHPNEWMEIDRYKRTATAYETASSLRIKYPLFRFMGKVDQNTREGVLSARYIGADDGE